MSVHCIYQENDFQLFLGDEITLVEPENDPMFHNSSIGKFFKKKRCDKAVMAVKQRKWLEVYFELTLYLNGDPLREIDVEDDKNEQNRFEALDPSNPKDKSLYNQYTKTYQETGGYTFMRYLVKKGATITKNRL